MMPENTEPKKKFTITSAMDILGEANKVMSIINEKFDELELNLENQKKRLEVLNDKQKLLWEKVAVIEEEEVKNDIFKNLLSVNEEKVRLEEEIKETVKEAKRKYTYKKVIRAIKVGSESVLPKILDYFE